MMMSSGLLVILTPCFCFAELIGGFLDGEVDITGLGLQSCHCYNALSFYHSQLLFFSPDKMYF